MIDNNGSSWRRWDLHVHTPASLIANEYGGDTPTAWEKFITALEELPEDIKVIGINDYLFFDGYKKVLTYKSSGRLKNIELILPVIEFRLKQFVGHDKLKRLNYHIIFADENLLTTEQRETHFLSALRGKARLNPEYSDVSWAGGISKESLKDLGQAIVDSMPEDKKPSSPDLVQMGFDNINFEISDIEDLLGEGSTENTYLKDKYLKAIGKAEWEDFRWDGAIADKKTVINGAHIIFAASPDIATANVSKSRLTAQKVNDRLLHCSDAHTYRADPDVNVTTSKEIGHCFTWIKADPTFEGLKQILYEPTRVAISDTEPIEPTNTIDSFTLNIPKNATITVKQNDGSYKSEDFCFSETSGTYALSPYFNCLVGGRGTGKSTILNFLGQHSSELNSSKDFWKKLDPSFESKDASVFSFEGVKQFEFVGQSEVESFAMDKEAFTNAIYERADILSSNALTDCEDNLKPLIDRLSDYQQITEDVAELEEEMAELIIEADTLDKSIKITQTKEYSTIVDQITKDSNNLQELVSWRETIDTYRESLRDAEATFDDDEEDEDDASADSGEKTNSTEENVAQVYVESSDVAREHVGKALETLDESKFIELVDAEGALQISIDANEEALSKILEKAGLSDENILQVKGAPQRLVQIKDTLSKLQKRIDDKNSTLSNYGNTMASIGRSKSAFERQIHASIEPLNKKLKIQAEENKYKDIKEIRLEYYLDMGNIWIDIADEFYDFFEELYPNGERSDYVKEAIATNRAVFEGDHDQIQQFIAGRIKKSGDVGYLRFLNEVFSAEHNYKIFKAIRDRRLSDISTYRRIQVLYGGKGIEHASFGQKCTAVVVILILFGNYPLIIDEPEAHLDGSLIANYLVPLIKDKKQNRQIIFATHNANFVVNGDAEKIIILKNDGHTDFIETTIENQSYREDLLNLEGGKEAFKKRSDKLKILT